MIRRTSLLVLALMVALALGCSTSGLTKAYQTYAAVNGFVGGAFNGAATCLDIPACAEKIDRQEAQTIENIRALTVEKLDSARIILDRAAEAEQAGEEDIVTAARAADSLVDEAKNLAARIYLIVEGSR